MSQPVKLSDGLVQEARLAGAAMQRSIAGQVEFWANLGKAVEAVATRRQIERLHEKAILPLSEIVRTIDQPVGHERLKTYLDSRPFPRFAVHPELAGMFVREEIDGTRTEGHFSRGIFVPAARETAV